MIDKMMPNVKNSEFKTQLQTTRTSVEQHLRQAEHLQQILQVGTTTKHRTTGTHQ